MIDETLRREFESDWLSGRAVAIEDYLPEKTDEKYLSTLEELVCIDLEFAWKDPNRKNKPLVENYVEQFSELDSKEILSRLVKQEIRVRSAHDTVLSPQEYSERFPGLTDVFQTTLAGTEVGDFDHQPSGDIRFKDFVSGEQAGRYFLLDQQGKGGFGYVWRADDPKLGRQIAIKQLTPPACFNEKIRKRFVTEARIAAQLEHPGIVPVYDVDELSSNQPYYTMKLVQGSTLDEVIHRFHSQSRSIGDQAVERLKLLNSFLSICRTMQFAHSRGIIHRDLKPQNIILGEFGETIILDWGLAKDVTINLPNETENADGDTPIEISTPIDLTQPGAVQGTPAFMAPEQAAGENENIDEQSDLFSLGTILYQLLTGKLPFHAPSVEETIDLVIKCQFVRPRAINSLIPKSLEAICITALEKDKQDRYSDIGVLANDVEKYIANEPVDVYQENLSERIIRWTRRHRAATVAAAVALTLIAIVSTTALIQVNKYWNQAESARADEFKQRKQAEALAEENLELANKEIGLKQKAQTLATKNAELAATEKKLKEKAESALELAERREREAAHQLYLARLNVVKRAIDEQRVGYSRGLLHKELAEKRQYDFRSFEWYLLWHRAWSLPHRFVQEGSTCADYSPAKDLVAIGFSNGIVRLLKGQSGENWQQVPHFSPIVDIDFSSDGNQLAVVDSSGKLQIWNTENGQRKTYIAPAPRRILKVMFSDDGRHLLGLQDGEVVCWETDNLTPINQKTFEVPPYEFAFSPDNKSYAVWLRNGKTLLIDFKTGKEIATLPSTDSLRDVLCLAYSNDGKKLVACGVPQNSQPGFSVQFIGDPDVAWSHAKTPEAVEKSEELKNKSDDNNHPEKPARAIVHVWDLETQKTIKVWNPDVFIAMGSAVSFTSDDQNLIISYHEPNRMKSVDGWLTPLESQIAVVDVNTFEIVNQFSDRPSGLEKIGLFDNLLCSIGYRGESVTLQRIDLENHKNTIENGQAATSSALAPDASVYASGFSDGTIKVFDAATGRKTYEFNNGTQLIRSIVFSNDGKRLATADDSVTIWDLASGEKFSQLKGSNRGIRCMAFSPDDRHFSIAFAGKDDYEKRTGQLTTTESTIIQWEIETGAEVNRKNDLDGQPYAMAYAPSGKRLTVSLANQVVSFDASSFEQIGEPSTNNVVVESLQYSNSGEMLAIGAFYKPPRVDAGGEVRIFKIDEDEPFQVLRHGSPISAGSFSNDDRIFVTVGLTAQDIVFWDVETGRPLQRYQKQFVSNTVSVGFNKDQDFVGAEGSGRMLSKGRGRGSSRFHYYAASVNKLAYAPNGKYLAYAGPDWEIKLRNVEENKTQIVLESKNGYVDNIDWSANNQLIAGNTMNSISAWNVESGSIQTKIQDLNTPLRSFCFIGSESILGIGQDFKLRTWDLINNGTWKVLDEEAIGVHAIYSSQANLAAVSTTRRSIILINPDTQERIGELTGHYGHISAMAFTQDGKTLISASDQQTIIVWNLEQRKPRLKLLGINADIVDLDVTNDAKTIAICDSKGAIRCWDLPSGQETTTLIFTELTHSSPGFLNARDSNKAESTPVCIAFSPNSRQLAVGGHTLRTQPNLMSYAGSGYVRQEQHPRLVIWNAAESVAIQSENKIDDR